MDCKKDSNENKNLKPKLIFIGIFTLFLVIIERVTKNYLKVLSEKFFFSTNKSRCELFLYTMNLENGLRYFFYYFAYNYINVYSSIFMMFLDTLGIVISHDLKLIYKDNRPFMEEGSKYIPCAYKGTYSTPDTTAMSLFFIFGTLYNAIKERNGEHNLPKRICIIILGVITTVYMCYVQLLENLTYLNSIILGLGFGFIIYFIAFHIFNIKFRDFSLLKIFFDNKYKTLLIIICVFILNTLLQYAFRIKSNEKIYERMKNIFPKNDPSIFLSNSNYITSSKIMDFLGFFIGLILEYTLVYEKDDDIYIRYNITEKEENAITMFNNTKSDISLFRLIIFLICTYYCEINFWITNINTSSYFYIILSLPLLEKLFLGILIFFVIKYLLKFLGLSNETLFKENKYKIDSLINNEN